MRYEDTRGIKNQESIQQRSLRDNENALILRCSAGAEDDLQDHVSRLRAMRWQAMEVRCEETEACDSLESLDSKRKFETRKVRELSPDGGMSELSKLCEGAGLQHMFLTAMKL